MNTISGAYGLSTSSKTSAINSGAATIDGAAQQLNVDAQQIANPNGPSSINPLVDLTQASQLAQAGADVVRTSNRVLGTLLNAFA
jgi:hypothetical protein